MIVNEYLYFTVQNLCTYFHSILFFLFKIGRAFEMVGATNGKIGHILWQIGNSINEQQAIQLIKDENKKIEHELAQLFGEFSGPSQSLTTSSLSSL